MPPCHGTGWFFASKVCLESLPWIVKMQSENERIKSNENFGQKVSKPRKWHWLSLPLIGAHDYVILQLSYKLQRYGDWLQIVFPCLALYFLLTWALLRLLCCRSAYYVNCTIYDYTLLHIKCTTVAIGKRNQKVGGFTALFPNYRTFENFYRCVKSL